MNKWNQFVQVLEKRFESTSSQHPGFSFQKFVIHPLGKTTFWLSNFSFHRAFWPPKSFRREEIIKNLDDSLQFYSLINFLNSSHAFKHISKFYLLSNLLFMVWYQVLYLHPITFEVRYFFSNSSCHLLHSQNHF